MFIIFILKIPNTSKNFPTYRWNIPQKRPRITNSLGDTWQPVDLLGGGCVIDIYNIIYIYTVYIYICIYIYCLYVFIYMLDVSFKKYLWYMKYRYMLYHSNYRLYHHLIIDIHNQKPMIHPGKLTWNPKITLKRKII